MSGLLKADFYRVLKSKLTMVILILTVALPMVTSLLFSLMRWILSMPGDDFTQELGILSANSLLESVFSLTNNVGLVIPAFAGIMVCADISNGTLRNKVICGNRRWQIYLSHLLVSMVFCVVAILIYAGATAGFAAIFLKYNKVELKTVIYWLIYGVTTFVYAATISTFLAMTFRSIAPTIIFTLLIALGLMSFTGLLSFMDTEKLKYLVYLIPTYSSSSMKLGGGITIADLFGSPVTLSQDTIFLEGILSFVLFGIVNTVLGMLIFRKKDIK